jgi:hypothetical protein
MKTSFTGGALATAAQEKLAHNPIIRWNRPYRPKRGECQWSARAERLVRCRRMKSLLAITTGVNILSTRKEPMTLFQWGYCPIQRRTYCDTTNDFRDAARNECDAGPKGFGPRCPSLGSG